jgi:hypothetical protein
VANQDEWEQSGNTGHTLHQGDTLQSMGTKEIMVGHGQHDELVSTAYGKELQTPADECIDWYASVIKKAWEDRPKPVRPKGVSGTGNIATLQ